MNNFYKTFFILTSVCLAQQKYFPIPQIEFNPKSYVCYRTDKPVIIDGNIEEEAWLITEWIEEFVDIEGELKPNPYYQTKVKMLWDENYFYFAAELEEEHIWASLTQKDTVIFYDNDFEIFIDPDGDTHNYYEVELNAFNTVWDLLLIKPYRDAEQVAVTAWDIKELNTAVSIHGTINDPANKDTTWTLEAAIPWQTFAELSKVNLPPKDKDTWRVNFSRVQWETEVVDGNYKKKIDSVTSKPLPENNWVWSPQGLIAMHYPEMWGFVQFSDFTAGSENVKFTPDPAEIIKWELRQIYYAQKNYYLKHYKFASSLDELKIKLNPVDFKMLKYNIETASFGYKASIEFMGKEYMIFEDGKIVSSAAGK